MKENRRNKTGANMSVTTTIPADYLLFEDRRLVWLQATRYKLGLKKQDATNERSINAKYATINF